MQFLNRYLDAAVLRPELTRREAEDAIKLCLTYGVHTVCVRPCDVPAAVALCRGTDTLPGAVLAFPHGIASTEMKAAEAELYARLGAREIDMVANYGLVKSHEWGNVERDIGAAADVANANGILLKVILETCYLTAEEIAGATEAAIRAGAGYVKTSTGFAAGGATPEAVCAMVEAAKGRIKVKASGGIRDYDTAMMYLNLGAERLGVNYSAVKGILDGTPDDGKGGY